MLRGGATPPQVSDGGGMEGQLLAGVSLDLDSCKAQNKSRVLELISSQLDQRAGVR